MADTRTLRFCRSPRAASWHRRETSSSTSGVRPRSSRYSRGSGASTVVVLALPSERCRKGPVGRRWRTIPLPGEGRMPKAELIMLIPVEMLLTDTASLSLPGMSLSDPQCTRDSGRVWRPSVPLGCPPMACSSRPLVPGSDWLRRMPNPARVGSLTCSCADLSRRSSAPALSMLERGVESRNPAADAAPLTRGGSTDPEAPATYAGAVEPRGSIAPAASTPLGVGGGRGQIRV
mmetsp:Transcript_19807/g.53365  ORF Transcript_19807/g.53365 Transcript_19807/m.53365 type:complete len:233 (+) Transcript_19807:1738-2436(+)